MAPIVSPDGRYVLFASLANNLVLISNNLPLPVQFPVKLNVFLRDRTNRTTTLVSGNLAGHRGRQRRFVAGRSLVQRAVCAL